jgi:ferric-dicitrate binding protein FerR (iron transport regulator)
MNRRRFAELLELWIDDRLDDSEDQELAALLRAPGRAGTWAREQVALAGLVAQAVNDGADLHGHSFQQSVRAALDSERDGLRLVDGVHRAQHRRRSLMIIGSGLAAAAALLIAVLLNAPWQSRSIMPLLSTSGMVVEAGAWIEATDAGAKELLWPDGVSLSLRPGTRLQVSSQPSDRRAIVERGVVDVAVDPDQASGRVRFATAHGFAEVTGTEFTLHSDAKATRLSVLEGSVLFRSGTRTETATTGTWLLSDGVHLSPARPERVRADLQLRYRFDGSDTRRIDQAGQATIQDADGQRLKPGRSILSESWSGPLEEQFTIDAWLAPAAIADLTRVELLAFQALDSRGGLIWELQLRVPVDLVEQRPPGQPLHLVIVGTGEQWTYYRDGQVVATVPLVRQGETNRRRVDAVQIRISDRAQKKNGRAGRWQPHWAALSYYSRPLSAEEVARNFSAGPDRQGPRDPSR